MLLTWLLTPRLRWISSCIEYQIWWRQSAEMLCCWEIWISLGLWLMLTRLRVVSLGNMLRKIRRLGLGAMTILSRNRVVEIARRVNRSFQLLPLYQLVFHPPRIGMTRRVEHQTLSLREVFQAPRLIPLALSVARTIQASVSQERKDVLGAVSMVTCWGIILLDRVKELEIVELNLQLQQH